jgi:hypothetical protein
MSRSDQLDATKKIMGALLRMPPKPHDEMKVGNKPMKNIPNKRKRGKVAINPAKAKT